MSELINKYTELHEELIDLLVQYHRLHLMFLDRQAPSRTQHLRKVLKKMRLTIKEMEQTAQLRRLERSAEWGLTHRVKKEKDDE